jgi:outer membrane receptor for Fe3+-dicitrate
VGLLNKITTTDSFNLTTYSHAQFRSWTADNSRRKNNEPLTWVLLQVWQDVVIIGCSSLSAAVSADGILLGF